ncbi:MAG: PIN domain-containing protein, partial [Lachnospiraceae bacterium]|nr:PIN domain-containing protein [Lachnospiraceae bacterium]
MKRIIYIDFENVSTAGLNGILDLNEKDHVKIFLGPKCSKLSLIEAEAILHCHATVELITNDQIGKNALDFIIMVHMGYDIAKKAGKAFYIISNDKGYEPAIHEMQSMTGLTIERLADIRQVLNEEEPAKGGLFGLFGKKNKQVQNMTEHEVYEKGKRVGQAKRSTRPDAENRNNGGGDRQRNGRKSSGGEGARNRNGQNRGAQNRSNSERTGGAQPKAGASQKPGNASRAGKQNAAAKPDALGKTEPQGKRDGTVSEPKDAAKPRAAEEARNAARPRAVEEARNAAKPKNAEAPKPAEPSAAVAAPTQERSVTSLVKVPEPIVHVPAVPAPAMPVKKEKAKRPAPMSAEEKALVARAIEANEDKEAYHNYLMAELHDTQRATELYKLSKNRFLKAKENAKSLAKTAEDEEKKQQEEAVLLAAEALWLTEEETDGARPERRKQKRSTDVERTLASETAVVIETTESVAGASEGVYEKPEAGAEKAEAVAGKPEAVVVESEARAEKPEAV